VNIQTEVSVPTPKDTLKERLARYRQISVIGRKSGQKISISVWFVFESNRLFLLPVQGSRAGSLLPLPFPPTHKAAL
jgi:hypothetical protein